MKVDTYRSKARCDLCSLAGWRGVPLSAE